MFSDCPVTGQKSMSLLSFYLEKCQNQQPLLLHAERLPFSFSHHFMAESHHFWFHHTPCVLRLPCDCLTSIEVRKAATAPCPKGLTSSKVNNVFQIGIDTCSHTNIHIPRNICIYAQLVTQINTGRHIQFSQKHSTIGLILVPSLVDQGKSQNHAIILVGKVL